MVVISNLAFVINFVFEILNITFLFKKKKITFLNQDQQALGLISIKFIFSFYFYS